LLTGLLRIIFGLGDKRARSAIPNERGALIEFPMMQPTTFSFETVVVNRTVPLTETAANNYIGQTRDKLVIIEFAAITALSVIYISSKFIPLINEHFSFSRSPS